MEESNYYKSSTKGDKLKSKIKTDGTYHHHHDLYPDDPRLWNDYYTWILVCFGIFLALGILLIIIILGATSPNNNDFDDDDDGHHHHKDVLEGGGGPMRDRNTENPPIKVDDGRIIISDNCDLMGMTIKTSGEDKDYHINKISLKTDPNLGFVPNIDIVDMELNKIIPPEPSKRIGNTPPTRTNLYWVWGLFIGNCLFNPFIDDSTEIFLNSDRVSVMNKYAPIIDGGCIYGRIANGHNIRTYVDGKIKLIRSTSGDYIAPISEVNGVAKYKLYDKRMGSNAFTSALVTLFMREHNKICDKLKEKHSDWDDELIYQMAKKIVASEIQAITYEEWLPLLHKKEDRQEFVNNFRAYFSSDNVTNPDPTVAYTRSLNRPNILSEFVTIAVPSMWSGTPNTLPLVSPSTGDVVQFLKTENLLWDTEIGKMGVTDALLTSLCVTQMNEIDWIIEPSIMNLVRAYISDVPLSITLGDIVYSHTDSSVFPRNYSLALPLSWLIARQRSMEVKDIRNFVGLHSYKKWEDLKFLNNRLIDILRGLYKSPENIDPIIQALIENKGTHHLPDQSGGSNEQEQQKDISALGFVLSSLWETQLMNVAKNDPHFFLLDYNMKPQRERLEDVRISDIILRNTKTNPDILFPVERESAFIFVPNNLEELKSHHQQREQDQTRYEEDV